MVAIDKAVLIKLIKRYGDEREHHGKWDVFNSAREDPYHRDQEALQKSNEILDSIEHYLETGNADSIIVL